MALLWKKMTTEEVATELAGSFAFLFSGIEADFAFCGHPHLPMVRKIGDKTFANSGSVGPAARQRHGGELCRLGPWRSPVAPRNMPWRSRCEK